MIDLRNSLIAPDSASSEIAHNVGVSASPFTGGEQITELPGAKWKLSYTYSNLSVEHGRIFKVINAMLRGGAAVAVIRDYSYIPRNLTPDGEPKIAGDNQVGTFLTTYGWDANKVILKAGDQVSYVASDGMHRMHMVTSDVLSNQQGRATIPILPPIKKPPVSGAALETINVSVSVRLTNQSAVKMKGLIVDTSYEFTEALYSET